jgi:hypothetical protein
VVFSVALMFAFIELPRLLDNLLQNNYKTELYIQALHLRLVGSTGYPGIRNTWDGSYGVTVM